MVEAHTLQQQQQQQQHEWYPKKYNMENGRQKEMKHDHEYTDTENQF